MSHSLTTHHFKQKTYLNFCLYINAIFPTTSIIVIISTTTIPLLKFVVKNKSNFNTFCQPCSGGIKLVAMCLVNKALKHRATPLVRLLTELVAH